MQKMLFSSTLESIRHKCNLCSSISTCN